MVVMLEMVVILEMVVMFVPVFADEAAQEALTDMPPRSEQELDPVSLHNQALMNMESSPTEVSRVGS